MPHFHENFFRAFVHATEALQRGDYPNIHKWMRLADRQLADATRFSDLQGQTHRPGKANRACRSYGARYHS